MLILGIETSCDETSICILREKEILSLKTFSQIALHKNYGGIVPEIAARSHIEVISYITQEAFKEAKIEPRNIDLIACTDKPGLIGGLLVGINFAKGLSLSLKKPLIFVNHLEGHIFTCALTEGIEKNFYCLLVSGGHTQILEVENLDNYKLIGQTIDDSAGEAFDKISRSLGFGYPGGAIIEKLALNGNEDRFKIGVPLKGKNKFDFSFSGLKTHFLKIVSEYRSEQDVNDICASFQKSVCNTMIDRMQNMMEVSEKNYETIVVCGGVSANKYIRLRFEKFFPLKKIVYAPLELCTDNAAMIANIGRMKSLSIQ
jgi:N6-L-threonylcarbamoyladenine synthase